MLPGKTYTPVDYLMMAWMRRWFIIIPTVIVGCGVFVWSRSLPNLFQSETSVLIVPQRVPEDYVKSTITTQIEDRLQMISQQILSRSRLERIIQEFDLYEEERKTMIMEDIIERMRRDVGIQVMSDRRRRGSEATAFRVSYQSERAATAQKVADRLASLFVQENLEDRGLLAESTNQFLQSQLDDAKRRLIEHERKLEEFRQRNAGSLPSQVQSNVQRIQNAQVEYTTLADAANSDRNRLTVLEGVLAEAAASPAPSVVHVAGSDSLALPLGTSAQQLEAAKAGLRALELRGRLPGHPDVRTAKNRIAELEAKAEAEALEQPLTAGGNTPVVRQTPNSGESARMSAMRVEAQEIRGRLDMQRQDGVRLQKVIASYATRIDAAPGLESELTELMRDYSTLSESYNTLSAKNEESKMALNLERRQIGEQFTILDSARLPERPVSPNRSRLNLMGLAAGLGFGLALVGLLEYRDTTFKTDSDIVTGLALPVLAVVPAMVSARERRMSQRRRLVVVVAGSAAVTLVAAAVVVWRLRLLDGLVP